MMWPASLVFNLNSGTTIHALVSEDIPALYLDLQDRLFIQTSSFVLF
jgi:hypothetical protein